MRARRWDRLGNGGLSFTELSLGTAPLGGLFHAVSERDAEAAMEAAWAAGIRAYDTAPLYGFGLAETRLGRFLRGKPRGEYTLTTKVGRLLSPCPPERRSGVGKWFGTPSRREVYDYSFDGVMRSVEHSLERLGADRIDALLVHDIDVPNHGSRPAVDAKVDQLMAGGYHALERLRGEGVIAAFGAGVNEWEVCERLALRGDFDLFLLAGRYTLLEQEALASFLPLCEARGIGVVIGGAFNSGILATGAREGATYDYEPAPAAVLERVRRIERVCAAHGVQLIDAALRFPLLHPAVVTVAIGVADAGQAERAARSVSADVPPALWADLKAEGLMRRDAPTGGASDV